MIEVLVAVLVMSIGLLGLAALQAATVRFNHSAYMRSQATNHAYDILDRMRANREAALDNEYDSGFESDPACLAAPAAGGSIAADDLAAWRNAMACTLPLGTGSIRVTGDGVVTILVRWDESRGEGSEAQVLETFDMTTGL